jgi:DNA-binding beta-propeller fold protein YncE
MNADGTLVASSDSSQHCVYIYSVLDCTADPVVVGIAGTAGILDGQLDSPGFVCFVHRHGIDTLLICDAENNRVVEVTVRGVFLRVIAMKNGSFPLGIAYCGVGDVIAVSLFQSEAVVLVQYESGAVNSEVIIGSGMGSGDGQLCAPHGVGFTADGRFILAADWGNHRVSKFSAASGEFIAHVATEAENGILYPTGVLQCEDGSIVVAAYGSGHDGGVVYVGEDGGTVQHIILPSPNGGASPLPFSLSYSVKLKSVLVKTRCGGIFILRDAWFYSSRCAWLSALSCF